MKAQVKNAADSEQVKDAQDKLQRVREREIEDVRFILNDKRGRRFLWRQLEECGVFRSSANNSGSWTYFNEGQRNIGLKLLTEITDASPDAYLLMLKENKELTSV